MRKRSRVIALDRLLATLCSWRVTLDGPARFGGVDAYVVRVVGHPAEHLAGYRFPFGVLPFMPERLEWLRDICRNWWRRGVVPEHFTYEGPPRQPSLVRLRLPRWALPTLARRAEEALARDYSKQTPYGADAPYRS